MSSLKELERECFNAEKFVLTDIYEPDFNDVPTEFKEWGFPIPYYLFYDFPYDIKQRKDDSLDTLLSDLKDLKDSKNFRIPGLKDGNFLCEELQYILSRELKFAEEKMYIKPMGNVIRKDDRYFYLNPIKLALYLSIYIENMDHNFEIIDVVNEMLDKLFLIAFMPYIFEEMSEYFNTLDANKEVNVIKNILEEKIKIIQPNFLREKLIFEESAYIKIRIKEGKISNKSEDIENPSYINGKKYYGKDQVLITINMMDELLSDACKENYERIRKAKTGSGEDSKAFKEILTALEINSDSNDKIEISDVILGTRGKENKKHSWLYQFTKLISKFFRRGYSLNTVEFDYKQPIPPTVTDEINLRVKNWTGQAFKLAGEKFYYKNLIKEYKEILGKNPPGTSDPQSNNGIQILKKHKSDFFMDWLEYGDIIAEIDNLKQEVSDYGYKVDFENVDNLDATTSGLYKTVNYQSIKKVTKYRTEIRHHSKRVGRWWKKRTQRWTTSHQIPYQVEVKVTKGKDEPISVDWNPITSYLEKKIDKSVYLVVNSSGQTNEFKVQDRLYSEYIREFSGNTEGEIINKNKDFRIFSILGDQLIDQYGNDLGKVLKEVENPVKRCLFLLILPVIESDFNGEPIIVSYKAIHNPLGPRNNYSIPVISILENIESSIWENKDYYIGPLTHTETLLPGEKRSFKVISETKYNREKRETKSEKIKGTSKSTSSIQQQVRNEVNKKLQETQKNTWSVSVSANSRFGFGKVSGSASANGSYSKSLDNTINSLNDKVGKTMSEVSQEQEVIIKTEAKDELLSVNKEENLIEIENYNTGSSVTHRFHQILRKIHSKSAIKGLKILVTYDEEFIFGYGFRKTEVLPLEEIDSILPQFIEEEREKFIEGIKDKIIEHYLEKKADNNDERSILLRELSTKELNPILEEWNVNSGSYVIITDLSNKSVLEQFAKDLREEEVLKAKSERLLIDAKREAISSGILVYPENTKEFSISINHSNKDDVK